MRGGALPPGILCAAVGLALASADCRSQRLGAFAVAIAAGAVVVGAGAAVIAAGAAVIGAGAAAWSPLPTRWTDAVFLGCWSSTVINSTSVLVGRPLGRNVAVMLAANSGMWVGAVIAVAGRKADLLWALPCTLTLLPASWVARRGGSIAVKVVSSWLIAIAVLAATLQFLPVTPGYLPDHME